VTFALLALAYLLGAIPSSYWVGKSLHGVDLREHGSGNLGATNAFRILGWKSALPVVVTDIFKGFLPVWLFPGLVGASFGWSLAFGGAAIVGHIFSIWVGFKGGKGVATSAGVFLAIAPWAVLGGFAVWAVIALGTRYISLGSIGASAALPLLVWLTPHQGGAGLLAFTTGLSAFVIWAHRSNIGRLLRGEENRFGRAAAQAGSDEHLPEEAPDQVRPDAPVSHRTDDVT